MSEEFPHPGTAAYAGRVLVRRRLALHWSQQQLIHHMRHLSADELPADESLRKMISKWEHGAKSPSGFYRALLCASLGLKVGDLRLPPVTVAYRPYRPAPRHPPTGDGPPSGAVRPLSPGSGRAGPVERRADPYPRAA